MMATDDRATSGVSVDAQPIADDHVALRGLMERLDEMLGALVANDFSKEEEMLELLGAFRTSLLAHFEREEQSGVLENAAQEQPRFAGRIEALLGEHAGLRTAAESLAEGAAGEGWGDFEARFEAFRDALAEHERAENEVLTSVYLDDIGGHH